MSSVQKDPQMSGNRKTPVRLSIADQYRVMQWVDAHKSTATMRTLSQAGRAIKAELGIEVGNQSLSNIEKAVGIERTRGGTPCNRKDRSVVIAQELVRLMKQLGVVPSDDLKDISEYK